MEIRTTCENESPSVDPLRIEFDNDLSMGFRVALTLGGGSSFGDLRADAVFVRETIMQTVERMLSTIVDVRVLSESYRRQTTV
jgi:hypothetical protein